MRLIDADALKETIVTNVYPVTDYFNSRDYGMFWTGGIEKAIDDMPTIELDIIRCKDCVHADEYYHCDYMTTWNDGDCFCSHAERRVG